jgi:hypothetical protein
MGGIDLKRYIYELKGRTCGGWRLGARFNSC